MSPLFDIQDTPIQGLKIIQRRLIGDHRGYLERMFCLEDLDSLFHDKKIVQINHTVTEINGTVRGMHFQYPPHAETKLVSCLYGEVFDVAIDLRRDSPSFLFWHAEILSAENHKTLVIPEGFAHGFQTLTENCEMLYFHTAFYRPDFEGGLNARDPRLGIYWPINITELSDRDRLHPMIEETFEGVVL
jgi:dTDP-4-dehydrorhamnose 3,5-epimerase